MDQSLGISGAGGTGTGSFSYAMDHPFERMGHWIGNDSESAGSSVDSVIADSGGVTGIGGPVTLPVRVGITLIGRGWNAIFED